MLATIWAIFAASLACKRVEDFLLLHDVVRELPLVELGRLAATTLSLFGSELLKKLLEHVRVNLHRLCLLLLFDTLLEGRLELMVALQKA